MPIVDEKCGKPLTSVWEECNFYRRSVDRRHILRASIYSVLISARLTGHMELLIFGAVHAACNMLSLYLIRLLYKSYIVEGNRLPVVLIFDQDPNVNHHRINDDYTRTTLLSSVYIGNVIIIIFYESAQILKV